MATGNAVISDKMQFPSGGGSSGNGEIHHPRQWVPDERDGFIMWLRGEFAAANAIIDALCHHLRCIGDPGEYEFVVGCVQQRRCNWSPVLHMQQYFSVGEVTYALQQVTWRRQQRVFDQQKGIEKDVKRSGFGYRHTQKPGLEPLSRDVNLSVNGPDKNSDKREQRADKDEGKQRGEIQQSGEKASLAVKDKEGEDGSHVDSNLKNAGNSSITNCTNLVPGPMKDGSTPDCKGTCKDVLPKGGVDTIVDKDEKQKTIPVPKIFVGTENFDQKMVNVVEGLKLYEEFLDSSEISNLVSLANEMRAAGRRGELGGQTYVASKRPTKGHGREMIQLGVPMADGPPEDEHSTGTSKDRKVEPIPSLLQEVINKFLHLQVTTSKPDACIIDFFNEGDHSQPHACPPWFGRPISILPLTECDVVFGRFITTEHPGEYKGSLRLSLSAGSLLVMQGKSADFAKRAFSSLRKQRILVTFTKSHPKKSLPTESPHLSPAPAIAASPPPSAWGAPPSSRPPNTARHPAAGPKHFAAAPATGVLPAPSAPLAGHQMSHPQQRLPGPNGIQPLFMTAPMAPPMPYPTPVPQLPPASAAWQVVPPRPATPRLPLPGTGVFLPPTGSAGHSPTSQQAAVATTAAAATEAEMAACTSENETVGVERSSASVSNPKGKADGKVQRQDCNGSANSVGGGKVPCKDEQQNVNHKKKVASSKPAAAAVK